MSDDSQPATEKFHDDVLDGMRQKPKRLPCKYFYDVRGCELFEQICDLEEYYLTRTELAIMQQSAGEMAEIVGGDCMLIELGSGASLKTRLLLDRLNAPVAYVPVDIARDHLLQTADGLSRQYPDLEVLPVCADFAQPFSLPSCRQQAERRVVYFPGSTMGNFEPAASKELLRSIAELCGRGGGLLIGLDLQKDPAVIEAAYNDARGVTAEFNLNLLTRINRELGGDFQLDQFQHRAHYNQQAGRIEMHLISQADQTVHIGGESFSLTADETICTEYSHKYDLDEFAKLAAEVGFCRSTMWTDPDHLFAVVFFTV